MKRFIRLLVHLIVALSAIGACVALYRLGIMAVLGRILPPDSTVTTAVSRIGVTAALFLGYWGVARYYERRSLTELSFKPLAISIAALAGVVLMGVTLLPLYASSYYRILSFRGFSAALPIASVIVLGVVFEEVAFRGVIFRILEQHAGTARALVVQALVFGALHLFNEGTTAMTFLSVTLLGAFWALIFVYSRSLWASVANHAAWNLTIFATGVPLSGQEQWRLSAPFESGVRGPVWVTGGGFGPEDSVINIVVMACALGGLGWAAWRKGSFSTGSVAAGGRAG